MSKTEKNVVVSGAGSEMVVSGMGKLIEGSKKPKVTIEEKAQREMALIQEWERVTKEKNPQLVLGSTRRPTEEDLANLGKHCHGMVCEITCQVCGAVRVINKQDAFQAKRCNEHKKASRNMDDQIKMLEAKLASLQMKKAVNG